MDGEAESGTWKVESGKWKAVNGRSVEQKTGFSCCANLPVLVLEFPGTC